MQPLQNVPIAMLIGYNCAKALMPLEVVASEEDGPFAVRTILGWGIVGELPDVKVDDCMKKLETKKTKNIERRSRRRQARRGRRYVEVSSNDKPKCSGLSCFVFVALLRKLWTLAWLAGLIAGWTVLRLLWTVARTTGRAAVEVALKPQCDWAEKTSLVPRFGKRIRLRHEAISRNSSRKSVLMSRLWLKTSLVLRFRKRIRLRHEAISRNASRKSVLMSCL